MSTIKPTIASGTKRHHHHPPNRNNPTTKANVTLGMKSARMTKVINPSTANVVMVKSFP